MSTPVFPQKREADLLAWSTLFSGLITAAPTTYGLTALQATAYAALHTAFATALATANAPATNSKTNVETKNTAKQNLLYGSSGAWQLVNIIQAFPNTTDTMRSQLNIRIPDTEPTPVPVPTEAPVVDVVSTFGATIKVKVHRASEGPNTTSGKPPGVKGASVFWFAGENAPVDADAWHFATNTTKNVVDVILPATTTPGSKVWLVAFWLNAKMESGPTSSPVSIHIPGVLGEVA